MKKSLLFTAVVAVTIIISVTFMGNTALFDRIPDPQDTEQIMNVMNEAYQVLGKASENFDTSDFSKVFIDTEDYTLSKQEKEVIVEILGITAADAENAGYLTAMQAKYISRARGAKLLQDALDKAKAEGRNFTASELQEIARANRGQMLPSKIETSNKTILTFQSIEIDGDKAIVRYDDGAALQDAILVKKEGKWLIASMVPVWVHY